MKKLVTILMGIVILGITATSVSAAEYKVQKGDSLWKIANENNTSVEMLMEINEMKSSLIHPKQELKLATEEMEEAFYTVQEGDTLIHISNEYGDDVTVEKLKEWNELSSDLIITGQRIIVDEAGVELKAPKVPKEPEELEEPEESQEPEESVEEPVVESNADANEETAENQVESTEKAEETPAEEIQGQTFAVEATAYTAGCAGCSGITATGINLNNDPYAKVIAVDPNVIPLGTQVYVEGYGYAIAGDTGGAIKGYKIDIHVPTKKEAYNWGRRTVEITILE